MAGPWGTVATPAHTVLGTIESMAAEYYDPTSDAPAERWEKRPSGDVDLGSGRLTGEDFPDNGHWKQV